MNWGRLKMVGALVGMVGPSVALTGEPGWALVILFFVYLPWVVVTKLIVGLSRFAGGIAMILLSYFPFLLVMLGGWRPFGAAWALIFGYGSWLAIIDAAKLRTW